MFALPVSYHGIIIDLIINLIINLTGIIVHPAKTVTRRPVIVSSCGGRAGGRSGGRAGGRSGASRLQ